MIWLLACAPALVPPEVVDDPGSDWDADGYSERQGDCDDADPLRSPGIEELCDGVDNDCDGVTDEAEALDARTWYLDLDGDGFGAAEQRACARPWRGVEEGGDCDDTDPLVSPAGQELCDGLDQDCDGQVDEDAADASSWYADEDGDGAGDAASSQRSCEQPEGFVADDQDCDDGEPLVAPGRVEVCGDGLDNDCSGLSAGPCWDAEGVLGADLLQIRGEAGGDELGRGLLVGQGLLAAAATGSDRGGQGSGMVYLFEQLHEDPDEALQVYGSGKNDNLGWAMALSGRRLFLAAPGASVDELDNSGVVYMLDREALGSGVVDEVAALQLRGSASSRLGRSLSLLDADADGDLDLAVGAPFAEGDATQSGAVWVFTARGGGERGPEDALSSLVGEGSASWLGSSSAGGDLDGDGVDELVIGAPGRRTTGSVYQLQGPISGATLSESVEVQGAQDGDFGASLVLVDLDGDGLDEVLVGSPGLGQVRRLDSGELVAEGQAGLGHAMLAPGDLDEDGAAELVLGLGAPEQDLDGGVWVLWGGLEGVQLVEDADSLGGGASDLGSALALGDVDLDGHADLVLGGPSLEADDRGHVLLLLGGALP